MARGINKVILVGNLGNDPDVKYTQSGMAITRISLATTWAAMGLDGLGDAETGKASLVARGQRGEVTRRCL